MAVMNNKRSIMTLYTSVNEIYSHQVRIVLAEKGVSVEYISVDEFNTPQDLADLNPYNSVPTLCDRDLVLYEPRIITEYLDERFPHPPLLPIYPVAKARSRLMIHRIDKEWYTPARLILNRPESDKVDIARNELKQSIMMASKAFEESKFFLSEDFSLMDCAIAPLLWRLQDMDITLTGIKAKPILKYMENIFNRESFQASLTEVEFELNEGVYA